MVDATNNSITPAGIIKDTPGIEQSADGKDFLSANLRLLENWYAGEVERRLKNITAVLREELQRQVDQMEAQYKQRGEGGETSSETLAEEISRSEANLAECTAQLESLIGDDGSKLVNLLRARSQELELKAYIRGLKFRVGER